MTVLLDPRTTTAANTITTTTARNNILVLMMVERRGGVRIVWSNFGWTSILVCLQLVTRAAQTRAKQYKETLTLDDSSAYKHHRFKNLDLYLYLSELNVYWQITQSVNALDA